MLACHEQGSSGPQCDTSSLPSPPSPTHPLAERIALELRCDPSTPPGELTPKQLVAAHDLLHQLRFEPPDGAHLSPAGALPPWVLSPLSFETRVLRHGHCTRGAGAAQASGQPANRFSTKHPALVTCTAGEYNLRLGIMKELRPEMVATHQVKR